MAFSYSMVAFKQIIETPTLNISADTSHLIDVLEIFVLLWSRCEDAWRFDLRWTKNSHLLAFTVSQESMRWHFKSIVDSKVICFERDFIVKWTKNLIFFRGMEEEHWVLCWKTGSWKISQIKFLLSLPICSTTITISPC